MTEAEWNELAELLAKIIKEAVHEAIRENIHPSVLRDPPEAEGLDDDGAAEDGSGGA